MVAMILGSAVQVLVTSNSDLPGDEPDVGTPASPAVVECRQSYRSIVDVAAADLGVGACLSLLFMVGIALSGRPVVPLAMGLFFAAGVIAQSSSGFVRGSLATPKADIARHIEQAFPDLNSRDCWQLSSNIRIWKPVD